MNNRWKKKYERNSELRISMGLEKQLNYAFYQQICNDQHPRESLSFLSFPSWILWIVGCSTIVCLRIKFKVSRCWPEIEASWLEGVGGRHYEGLGQYFGRHLFARITAFEWVVSFIRFVNRQVIAFDPIELFQKPLSDKGLIAVIKAGALRQV